MPVVTCSCGKAYRLQDGLAGTTFRCKACQTKLTVPADGAAKTPPPPAERLRPSDVDPSLVGGQGTVAGNPGLLSFSRPQFLRCYPAIVWLAIAAGLATGGLLWFGARAPVIAGAAVPIMAAVVLLGSGNECKSKFRGGNLCAALVIDTAPYRVAVLTDLSTGGPGPKLAVAIRRQSLAGMFGGPPRKGARLVAVSHYVGYLSKGYWDNFLPTVINCGCADRDQIERATASMDPVDWQVLERVVPKLKSQAFGLYKLWELPQVMAAAGMGPDGLS